ncbi:hypothetical protein O6R08_11135 [Cutibacterium equinum]|uniref:N-acetyltransferase domain-containing protein n=1 Tax=Cutibacterium equinum TaxID=3016342 RepID=A0ABY7QZK9_9ACTN|nr:hypothetical protein [Cutibacterium equinum]WCC79969.1 hypothetical protein O6R08_11135 [Cutibacterium equinum]
MRIRHLTTLTRKDAASPGVSGKLRPWGIDVDSPLPDWADAACRAWGFFGVASRHADQLDGIILVAPESCLPAEHPMSKIPRTPGGAVLVGFLPHRHDVSWGRVRISFLAARLHGAVPVIEAGGVVGPYVDRRLAPTTWLESWGFQEVDHMCAGPVRRMRLDLRRTVKTEESWAERWFGWLRGNGLAPADVGRLRWPTGSARHDHEPPAIVTQTKTQSPQQAIREPLT